MNKIAPGKGMKPKTNEKSFIRTDIVDSFMTSSDDSTGLQGVKIAVNDKKHNSTAYAIRTPLVLNNSAKGLHEKEQNDIRIKL